MARLAITSLAFMLLDVPEPVWKTSIGNSPSSLPVGHFAAGLQQGLDLLVR